MVFFGITTFLTQIETVVFLNYLVNLIDPEIIPRLFIQGFVVSLLFAPLAVLIFGSIRGKEEPGNQMYQTSMAIGEWLWKLLLVGVVYVIIYVTFGMFVFRPLAGDAFQQYYGDLQMPPWILPFQMLRGII
jgi:hypothetical protein